MKKIIVRSHALLLMLVMAMTASAFEPQALVRGIRPLGMGGAFVAVSDDQNAFFFNPAGLTQRSGGQFTLFELPLNVSEDIFNFYNFYQDNEKNLRDFDSLSNDAKINLLNDINDKMLTYRPSLRLGFPNTSYLAGSGFLSWGLGVFTQTELGFQFNRSLLIPSISAWGNADIIGAVPVAHRFAKVPYIPGAVSAGVTFKYLQRARIEEMNKSVLEFESFDPQLQWGQGFGFDAGALYQLNDRWNFGLQVTDVGGTTLKFERVNAKEGQLGKEAFNGMIPSQWNVGTAYIPSKIPYWPGKAISTHDRLILAADLRDILSADEPVTDATVWKKVHMGAEFRVGPLSLRGGFNSGYPAFGAGLRIPYLGVKAEYAYWGDEKGRYAGQLPSWNHQLNIALSWGDSKGRSYGSSAARQAPVTAMKEQRKKEKTEQKATAAPNEAGPAQTAQDQAQTGAVAEPPAGTEGASADTSVGTPSTVRDEKK